MRPGPVRRRRCPASRSRRALRRPAGMRASGARWRAADCRTPRLLPVSAAQPGNLGIRPGDDLAGRKVPRAAVALGTQVRGLPGDLRDVMGGAFSALSTPAPTVVTVAQAGD